MIMEIDDFSNNKSNIQSRVIDPEEILVDSAEENAPHIVEIDNRKHIWILFGAAILCMIVILGRSFYLQVVKGDYYAAFALENRIKTQYTRAVRGIIYDENGQPLVQNIPSFDLMVQPDEFEKNKQDKIYGELSKILEEPVESIKQYFSKVDFFTYSAQIVKPNIGHSKAIIIESKSNDLPGIKVEVNAIRDYIDSSYFSHILGYIGKINKQEYENNQDYLLDDNIGKTGLENIYEKNLRGQYGIRRLEVDSVGQVKRSLTGKEPRPGNNLVLTIDSGLQKKLQDSLTKMLDSLKLKKASAVAVDPRDGSVRALVSLPGFDNNLFSRGISQSDYEQLLGDPNRPLFNRAISGEYPPGSTIKPLVAVAALEEKVITAQKEITDYEGRIVIANPYNPSAPAVFNDWKPHGTVNLKKAIAESCNVYFYTIGGGYGDIKGLGISRIKKYAELFGLNKLTNIDLPFEKKGLIPDAEWKQKTKNENWYIGDTYNSSIGQGDVSVTPLQLANYIAAVANGGVLYRPHLLKQVTDPDGNIIEEFYPEILNKDFIDVRNISEVQKGMRQTVTDGSGRAINDLKDKDGNKVTAAGKTGTAQFAKDKTHAWFVSYAPYENPELALVVLVEEGGEGHSAAVPIAKEALEWYFGEKKFLTEPDSKPSNPLFKSYPLTKN